MYAVNYFPSGCFVLFVFSRQSSLVSQDWLGTQPAGLWPTALPPWPAELLGLRHAATSGSQSNITKDKNGATECDCLSCLLFYCEYIQNEQGLGAQVWGRRIAKVQGHSGKLSETPKTKERGSWGSAAVEGWHICALPRPPSGQRGDLVILFSKCFWPKHEIIDWNEVGIEPMT